MAKLISLTRTARQARRGRRPDRPDVVHGHRRRQRRADGRRRNQRRRRPARPAHRAAHRGQRDDRRGRRGRRRQARPGGAASTSIFGGILSSTRQAIKAAAVTEGRTLYIYPEQYEGQECDPLIFCTGPVPAQQVDPLIPWLIEKTGAKRFALPSADYIWPRIMNEKVREIVDGRRRRDRRGGLLPARPHRLRRRDREDHVRRRRGGLQHDRPARPSCRSSSSCTTPASASAAGISSARTSTRTA